MKHITGSRICASSQAPRAERVFDYADRGSYSETRCAPLRRSSAERSPAHLVEYRRRSKTTILGEPAFAAVVLEPVGLLGINTATARFRLPRRARPPDAVHVEHDVDGSIEDVAQNVENRLVSTLRLKDRGLLRRDRAALAANAAHWC